VHQKSKLLLRLRQKLRRLLNRQKKTILFLFKLMKALVTDANIKESQPSHWYYPDARPCYEVPYADSSKGMRRPTTLRDAKKLGLLPSVTTLLRILDKPGLNSWLREQAALAVLTSPRLADEEIDAFVKRVLQIDREQDEEAANARDLGSQIHSAIEKVLSGEADLDFVELAGYIAPAVAAVRDFGRVPATEKILVGEGYAGRVDAIVENDQFVTVVDFKTTKTLPKQSYNEHKLQLAAYAMALGNTGDKIIQTCNIYISTTNPGEIAVFKHSDDWSDTYQKGFKPLMSVWSWLNNYFPA
jgi:CRISPR/Cas system-associated exonuclease Cas4 (RecB family)